MQVILNLIENVDPADTAVLDEIDARVYCYLHCFANEYISHINKGQYILVTAKTLQGDDHYEQIWKKYTRSRDSLKAIRPEGSIYHYYESLINKCAVIHLGDNEFRFDGKKTEKLTELHAIIQAIEWERTNATK